MASDPNPQRSAKTRAPADPEAVEREVREIEKADLAALRLRWRSVFGSDPPPGVYRELMARVLAYRVQAEAFGDLERELKEKLTRLAKGDETALDEKRPRFKPGTILVREWQGTLHRVRVMETGYAWNGETFASLSATARAITGTNWNGPVFFGLAQPGKGKGANRGRAKA